MRTSKRWLGLGVIVLAASMTACASSRVVSTTRFPDATVSCGDPADLSKGIVALSEGLGWHVERADRRLVVVDTPRAKSEPAATGGARRAPSTWCQITIGIAPSAKGACTLSCSASTLTDGDVNDPPPVANPNEIGALVRAVTPDRCESTGP